MHSKAQNFSLVVKNEYFLKSCKKYCEKQFTTAMNNGKFIARKGKFFLRNLAKGEKMAKYKKCPRCELNYIPQDEEMCDVCKAELGLDTSIVLLDDIIDADEPLKLCPVCKTAYIGMDEEMCENCLSHEKDVSESDDESDDEWRSYLDDDDTGDGSDDDIISLEELEADEADDFDDDFEDEENPDLDLDDYPDDFDDDYDDEDDYGDEDEEDDD